MARLDHMKRLFPAAPSDEEDEHWLKEHAHLSSPGLVDHLEEVFAFEPPTPATDLNGLVANNEKLGLNAGVRLVINYLRWLNNPADPQ